MSWSDFFPVIEEADDEACFQSSDFQRFKVTERLNPKASSHIVVTSLYCGKYCDSLSDVEASGAERQGRRIRHLGCVGRRAAAGVAAGAERLLVSKPHVAVRVYLDADLEFLIPDLLAADCEVILMSGTSKGCCAGLMWRYLALKENDKLLTILEPEQFRHAESHVQRTETADLAGLNGWRVPRVSGDSSFLLGAPGYRPIRSSFFGSKGGLPIDGLIVSAIGASVWRGESPATAEEGGRVSFQPYTCWPETGFDEWFLLAAVYPRMAQAGVLTFVPQDEGRPCHSLLLDVEYTTWANQKSELVLYESPPPPRAGVSASAASEAPPAPVLLPAVEIRTDCTLLCRCRYKARRAGKNQTGVLASILPDCMPVEGSAIEALAQAGMIVTTKWWADLDESLGLQGRSAELFLDRRLDEADLAVSSWFFMRLDAAASGWAAAHGAESEKWRGGGLVKVPNLEGPMTFWKSSSSRAFVEEWIREGRKFRFEIFLALKGDLGACKIAEISPADQGWSL